MGGSYYFGLLAVEANFFSYPRTGSHLFFYCAAGLFDLVGRAREKLDNAEAVSRELELNPEVLYALNLREPGVPFQPVILDPEATGPHGVPMASERKSIILIRHPLATAYSRLRVEVSRWGGLDGLDAGWLRGELIRYTEYYNTAFDVLDRMGKSALLLRFEDLLRGPDPLEQLAGFMDVKPKLRPSFVWHMTQFDRMVLPIERTFYRSGNDDAWRADTEFIAALEMLPDRSFERFGYTTLRKLTASGQSVELHSANCSGSTPGR